MGNGLVIPYSCLYYWWKELSASLPITRAVCTHLPNVPRRLTQSIKWWLREMTCQRWLSWAVTALRTVQITDMANKYLKDSYKARQTDFWGLAWKKVERYSQKIFTLIAPSYHDTNIVQRDRLLPRINTSHKAVSLIYCYWSAASLESSSSSPITSAFAKIEPNLPNLVWRTSFSSKLHSVKGWNRTST